MQDYVKGPIIGEGTYGSVIRATHKQTGRSVAIKKIRVGSSRDGVHVSALREIRALRELGCGGCSHVVSLLDVFPNKAGNSLCLVFEHLDWSLEDVVRDRSLPLPPEAVKSYARQLLLALAHVHATGLVHRDVKPDNLLVDGATGVLKLADFGLARSADGSPDGDSSGKWTHQVFGRWYRPPELLFGATRYGPAVDMWAAGCVVAELMLRRPWFAGSCDMDQLDRVFKVLGVPTPEQWPGMAELPHRLDFKPAAGVPLETVFPQASPACVDLLKGVMAFDPDRRLTAAQALAHPWFSEVPAPLPPERLPRPAAGARGAVMVIPTMLAEMVSGLPRGAPLLGRGLVAAGAGTGAAAWLGGGGGSGGAALPFGAGRGGEEEEEGGRDRPGAGDGQHAEAGATALAALQPHSQQLESGNHHHHQQQQQQQRQQQQQQQQREQQQQPEHQPGQHQPAGQLSSLMSADGFPSGPGSGGQPSMRPPPHRASTGGGGGPGGAGHRRRLSDLNAALSSAAAGGGPGWGAAGAAGGPLAHPQGPQHHSLHTGRQQHAAAVSEEGHFAVEQEAPQAVHQNHQNHQNHHHQQQRHHQQQGPPDHAAAMADSAASGDAPATSEGACPMSLGSTALKRTRAVFESDGKWPAGGGAWPGGAGGRAAAAAGGGGGGRGWVGRAGSAEPEDMELGSACGRQAHHGGGAAGGARHSAAGPAAADSGGDLEMAPASTLRQWPRAGTGASTSQATHQQQHQQQGQQPHPDAPAAAPGPAAAAPPQPRQAGAPPAAPPATASGPRFGGPMSLDVSACEALRGLFRPRLDSDELVYLRQRTLDLDEALLEASQHGEAGLFGCDDAGGGGLFGGCSPGDGPPLPPEDAAGDTPACARRAAAAPDQSPLHKRRATPAGIQGVGVGGGEAACGDERAAADGGGGADANAEGAGAPAGAPGGGAQGPRRAVSQLQQEQLMLAAAQLAEQQRQAQLAAWAAAGEAGGAPESDGAGRGCGRGQRQRRGAGEAAARGCEEGDEEEGWSPRDASLETTGRVLFT